jgi:hypothetical protein
MGEQTWYRGNIHTHTTKSDGDAAPEKVVEWYKNHQYDFLVLSDHNHLTILDYGAKQTGASGVLMIPGEEVTVRVPEGNIPVHLNALGITRFVEPTIVEDVAKTIQANIDAILDAGGIACINHPNWEWAFDHEAILQTNGASLMEIFNASVGSHNYPIPVPELFSPSEIWDHVLTAGVPLFGVASDDSHHYHDFAPDKDNPGRAWVMVESEALEADAVVEAMAQGKFYSSTGIYIETLAASPDEISLELRPQRGLIQVTQFIGKNGEVFQETVGTEASYRPTGDEGYIRAAIRSSDGIQAWTQPVFIK